MLARSFVRPGLRIFRVMRLCACCGHIEVFWPSQSSGSASSSSRFIDHKHTNTLHTPGHHRHTTLTFNRCFDRVYNSHIPSRLSYRKFPRQPTCQRFSNRTHTHNEENGRSVHETESSSLRTAFCEHLVPPAFAHRLRGQRKAALVDGSSFAGMKQ